MFHTSLERRPCPSAFRHTTAFSSSWVLGPMLFSAVRRFASDVLALVTCSFLRMTLAQIVLGAIPLPRSGNDISIGVPSGGSASSPFRGRGAT
jgi:hypothetical protein